MNNSFHNLSPCLITGLFAVIVLHRRAQLSQPQTAAQDTLDGMYAQWEELSAELEG